MASSMKILKYHDEPLTTGGTSIYRTTHSDLCGVKFFFQNLIVVMGTMYRI
jgi:hypothetical protein